MVIALRNRLAECLRVSTILVKKIASFARDYSTFCYETFSNASLHKRFARDSLSFSVPHPFDFLLISRREDHSGKLVLGHPSSLSSSCERDRYAKQPEVITVRRSSTILKLLAAPLFYRRRGQRGFSQPILILPINLPCPFD